MSRNSGAPVRDLIVEIVAARVGRDALPVEVPEDFDLLTEGVIDSLGLVELIASLEERLGVEVDFAELDADDLTKVGPLAAYVEAKSNAG